MAFAADDKTHAPLGKSWHPFVVLLVGHSEFRARALEKLLESTGYAVMHAETAHRAIELALTVRPDAVIVGTHSADMAGVELCRRLTGSAQFSPATPVMVTMDEPGTRADYLETYSAGAWSICTEPVDEALLLPRLQTFIRARHVGERLRDGSFYDGATGLYNFDGLILRAREMGSAAGRRHEALAFIAFVPDEVPPGTLAAPVDSTTIDMLADTCRRSVRGSDAVGRVGASEFAIVAPCTDEAGARGLLLRLRQIVITGEKANARGFRGSICATSDARNSTFGAVEMLMQAVTSLSASA